jgi:hypothetical protein
MIARAVRTCTSWEEVLLFQQFLRKENNGKGLLTHHVLSDD